jgi:hypothetical protein
LLASARVPFHVLFRASSIDENKAFLVNRVEQLSSIALFDRFWNP